MGNKKFASFPILNSYIKNLDPESDLMTSVSFVILEGLHTLEKKTLKSTFQKASTTTHGKNPFAANVADFDAGFLFSFLKQIFDLKSDSSLKLYFGERLSPKCQVPNEHPILYEKALKMIIPFPS